MHEKVDDGFVSIRVNEVGATCAQVECRPGILVRSQSEISKTLNPKTIGPK